MPLAPAGEQDYVCLVQVPRRVCRGQAFEAATSDGWPPRRGLSTHRR